MNEIRPFRLDVAQSDLDDLHARLARTRWPVPETVEDASQGVRSDDIRHLVEHWRDHYDWRRVERELNEVGQYRTEIDGIDVHFLHARSAEPDAVPLLMTHGWPGSVLEFRKVIGPLTDPVAHGGEARDAFHVIAPSLPGFGFTSAPTERGWAFARTADAWITLMRRLGYERWGIQGGDLGSGVSESIAAARPAELIGMHLNFSTLEPTPEEIAQATPEEVVLLRDRRRFWSRKSSYLTQQQTRPQAIGFGLSDSPAGLAAWLYQNFQEGCATPDSALQTFSADELIDHIMLYWLPNAGVTSARMYWELRDTRFTPPATLETPIAVPTGYTQFPGESVRQSRRWLEARYPHLVHYRSAPSGGHFAALEEPDVLVADIRETFRGLR
jgi:epoxide hydrolase